MSISERRDSPAISEGIGVGVGVGVGGILIVVWCGLVLKRLSVV